jgi:hypothetical protein
VLLRGSSDTQIGPAQEWQDVVHDWVRCMNARESNATCRPTVKIVRSVIVHLVDAGVAPQIEFAESAFSKASVVSGSDSVK